MDGIVRATTLARGRSSRSHVHCDWRAVRNQHSDPYREHPVSGGAFTVSPGAQVVSVLIRPLAPADEPDWRRLWTAYLAFYETTVPEEIYRTYFERLLGNDPQDYSCLIADVDGRPAGLAHFLFHRHGWRIENVCYLQDLFADPEVRGRGVGRALIEGVYGVADAAGCPQVYWLTQHFNESARRLYDRIGVATPFMKYQRT